MFYQAVDAQHHWLMLSQQRTNCGMQCTETGRTFKSTAENVTVVAQARYSPVNLNVSVSPPKAYFKSKNYPNSAEFLRN